MSEASRCACPGAGRGEERFDMVQNTRDRGRKPCSHKGRKRMTEVERLQCYTADVPKRKRGRCRLERTRYRGETCVEE